VMPLPVCVFMVWFGCMKKTKQPTVTYSEVKPDAKMRKLVYSMVAEIF